MTLLMMFLLLCLCRCSHQVAAVAVIAVILKPGLLTSTAQHTNQLKGAVIRYPSILSGALCLVLFQAANQLLYLFSLSLYSTMYFQPSYASLLPHILHFFVQDDPLAHLPFNLVNCAKQFFSTVLWYCSTMLSWEDGKTLPPWLTNPNIRQQ